MKSRRNPRGWIFLVTAALGLTACGGNSLSGSMSDVFSLTFDTLVISKQDPSLLVSYKKGTDTVCQVVLNTQGLTLGDNKTVSGADFVAHVSFARAAQSGGSYTAPLSGQVQFTHYSFSIGGHVAGKFDSVLTDGHTLQGDFDGSLVSSGL
jgi:hypothetical protein